MDEETELPPAVLPFGWTFLPNGGCEPPKNADGSQREAPHLSPGDALALLLRQAGIWRQNERDT